SMIAEHGLEKNFYLLGFHADIKPLILGSDLFVLASRFEGMPNVVMEAMSVGIAVVATDVNGARELMEDGGSGLIVPPHNPAALSQAILQVIDAPATLESMGKRGQEIVRTKFTYDIMADNLQELLLDMLEKKGAEKKARVISSKLFVRKFKRSSLTFLSTVFFSHVKPNEVSVPQKIDSIVIFVQEKLGDALLLTPLIRLLANRFPDLKISLFTFSKASYAFFAGDPHIDQCYLIRLYNLPLLSHLCSQKYDLLFNPKDHPSNTFLLISSLLKARYKVAVNHDLHRGFYHRLLEVDFTEHVIKKNLALASIWGYEITREDLVPYLPMQEAAATLQSFADKLISGPIALNLSAGEPHRLWSDQSWIQLVEMITDKIIILAMPGERELKRSLEKRFAHVIVTPATTNLYEASLIIAKCRVLITPDTSLVHLCMMSDTPVIGLYRFDPVHHMRFAPLSNHSRKLVSPTHTICDIKPEKIYSALQEVLHEIQS
ncbi:MAG: glycosyltransferase, partial [Candidatus Cloacimonadaceae bacterium]|nr:glycosyltransferase [Candidatus Cloacimonadaceae bacterium]